MPLISHNWVRENVLFRHSSLKHWYYNEAELRNIWVNSHFLRRYDEGLEGDSDNKLSSKITQILRLPLLVFAPIH